MCAGPPTASAERSPVARPRFHWLRRRIVVVTLAVAGLVGVRIWWGHVAILRLETAIAAARARGEPVAPEDLDRAVVTVADDRNAAVALTRAATALRCTESEIRLVRPYYGDPLAVSQLTPSVRNAYCGLRDENATAIRLAHRAVGLGLGKWPAPVMAKQANASIELEQGDLPSVLFVAAAADAAAGEHGECVADLRSLYTQSDAMVTAVPATWGHPVASSVSDEASNAVVQLAPTLRLDAPAVRRDAEGLLRQICDDSAYRAGGRRECFAERLRALEVARGHYAAARIELPAIWDYLPVRPLLELELARTFGDYSTAATAACEPIWRRPAKPLPTRGNASVLDMIAAPLALVDLGSRQIDGNLRGHFQTLTNRRAAAVILAVRLYQEDHAGRLPDAVESLVPAYLPQLPIDPLSPVGHPLRFVHAAAGPIVYSVGMNGTDDGGSTAPMRPTPQPWIWNEMDAVYPYGSATAAATRPGQ